MASWEKNHAHSRLKHWWVGTDWGDREIWGNQDLLAQVRRGGETGPVAGGKLDIDRDQEGGALPTGAD